MNADAAIRAVSIFLPAAGSDTKMNCRYKKNLPFFPVLEGVSHPCIMCEPQRFAPSAVHPVGTLSSLYGMQLAKTFCQTAAVHHQLHGEGGIDIARIIQINIKTHYAEGDVNAYVMMGDPVTLVDTGIPTGESVQQLRDGLAAVGLSFADVGQIVVTHMHLDHCGGVMAIQSEADVPVFVHERAETVLTGGRREFDRAEAFMQAFVSQCGAVGLLNRSRQYREEAWKHIRYLKDGDTVLAGGDRFHVLEVPGHSQTDICLWSPETGDAFVGDYLLQKISANAFISPPPRAGGTRTAKTALAAATVTQPCPRSAVENDLPRARRSVSGASPGDQSAVFGTARAMRANPASLASRTADGLRAELRHVPLVEGGGRLLGSVGNTRAFGPAGGAGPGGRRTAWRCHLVPGL